MNTAIECNFLRNFETEVYLQYLQMGSKLRNTVRTKDMVTKQSTTFNKLGSTKSVECILHDLYAGDWVDDLDELKVNINEQQIAAKAGAYALGRKTDELIIGELSRSSRTVGVPTEGLTKSKVLMAFELLGECDVPDDGQRFAVVGWKQWSELLAIEEFSNSAYVGEDELPWKGTQAKRWLGSLWLPHSSLPKAGDVRRCFWYHKSAVGHAIASEVKTDITWHGDRAAHFVNNMMNQGAVLIDDNRIVTMNCLEW